MGKGIEEVMLFALGAQARSWGMRRLTASYIPTRKNIPVKTFLPDHAFVETQIRAGGIEYSIDLAEDALPMPRHVNVEMPEFLKEQTHA
jgi:predicted enzyme involved in methoxymalonyl-ACP biosynthesis